MRGCWRFVAVAWGITTLFGATHSAWAGPITQGKTLQFGGLIDSGGHTTCATDTESGVVCWGGGGLQGTGFRDNATPHVVPGISTTGGGPSGQISKLSVGGSAACIIQSGQVKCWGAAMSPAAGSPISSLVPVPIAGITSPTAVSVGNGFACVLSSNRSLKCWGTNRSGQLGDGTTTSRSVPTQVSGVQNFIAVDAGSNHVCAIREGGDVSCWGANNNYQLGHGTKDELAHPTPERVGRSVSMGSGTVENRLIDAAKISAGITSTCAIRVGGAVVCWGYNESRTVLGASTSSTDPFARVAGVTGAITVAAGNSAHCVSFASGLAKCWGVNALGQLGDGTLVLRSTPALVSGLTGAKGVVAGISHFCALKPARVECWGDNGQSALGNGNQVNSSVPVAVNGGGPLPGSITPLGPLRTAAEMPSGGGAGYGDLFIGRDCGWSRATGPATAFWMFCDTAIGRRQGSVWTMATFGLTWMGTAATSTNGALTDVPSPGAEVLPRDGVCPHAAVDPPAKWTMGLGEALGDKSVPVYRAGMCNNHEPGDLGVDSNGKPNSSLKPVSWGINRVGPTGVAGSTSIVFQAPLGAYLPHREELFGPADPGDGYLYFYGRAPADAAKDRVYPLTDLTYLVTARVRKGSETIPTSYRWYDGTNWVAGSSSARPIWPEPVMGSMSTDTFATLPGKPTLVLAGAVAGYPEVSVLQLTPGDPKATIRMVRQIAMPGCGVGADCWAVIGHPERSTSTSLDITYLATSERLALVPANDFAPYGHIHEMRLAW